jgi:Flp pilus assembly pilin Flp
LLGALVRDRRGASAVEFAFVAPVILLLVFGIFEVAVAVLLASTIEESVFQASRFGATGEDAGGTPRAERVLQIVEARTYGLIDMDDVAIETLVYDNFSDVGAPEPFADADGDGRHDAGESFTDVNGNARWDADMGRAGLGGPGDIVVYRVTWDWGIMTPLLRGVLGDGLRQSASVALRNEPF